MGHVTSTDFVVLEPHVHRAEVVVLACTETPLALDAIASPLRERCVDTNAALARACVAWWAGRAG